MEQRDTEELVSLAARAGEILLESGAELYRVQDTMTKIVEAYSDRRLNAYIISNGIFAFIQGENERSAVNIKYVPIAPPHMGRVVAVNNLSRRITAQKPPVAEARAELEQIAKMPFSPVYMQFLAAGVGSGCFCYLLKGTVSESLLALFTGMALQLSVALMNRFGVPKIIVNIFGSALAALLAVLYVAVGWDVRLGQIIIGAIMPLMPGVALTSGIRDLFSGDYVSGMIRLLDAVLVAFCIAVGVGAVLRLLG